VGCSLGAVPKSKRGENVNVWWTLLILLFLVSLMVLIWLPFRNGRLRDQVRDRLLDSVNEPDIEPEHEIEFTVSTLSRRYRWLVVICSIIFLGVLIAGVGFPWTYGIAFSVLFLLLMWQVEDWWFQYRLRKAEQQLAASIDMMVSAVKSGVSLQAAMESAMRYSQAPWKQELQEVVGRIRYGDNPIEVLNDLSHRVPLETVRLFAQSLAVNWSAGGRLAQTLANVGRTIRDRLELTQRMQAMTTQARLSIISVMGVTYFIAAIMWRNDPERMNDFLQSIVGQGMVSTVIVLQAVGIIWISWLSRPHF